MTCLLQGDQFHSVLKKGSGHKVPCLLRPIPKLRQENDAAASSLKTDGRTSEDSLKQVCLELLTLTVAVRDADDGMQYIAEAEEDDALPSTKILSNSSATLENNDMDTK